MIVNHYTCSFLLPDNFLLSSLLTRSILICITFALFSFQVAFLFLRTDISNQSLDYSYLYSDKIMWWAQMDSNHRPHAYQACALTT